MAVATPKAATPTAATRMSSARRREAFLFWLFVFPVVGGTLLFDVIPTIPTLYWSFTQYSGLDTPKWLGLYGYQRLFERPVFMDSIANTVRYVVGALPLTILAGLALGLLVNQKLKGITWFRAAFYLPFITSEVAVAMTWRWLFNTNFGLINQFVEALGFKAIPWLGHAGWAMVALIVVTTWRSMGYNMILFLAGLQGIPQHLIEAAEIDGAGAWRRFIHITLPLLTPTIFLVVILSVIGLFQTFTIPYMLAPQLTQVYMYRLYASAFREYDMGAASAMGWALFVVIGIVTAVQWKLQDRWVYYG